jgi:hypothetical protein
MKLGWTDGVEQLNLKSVKHDKDSFMSFNMLNS